MRLDIFSSRANDIDEEGFLGLVPLSNTVTYPERLFGRSNSQLSFRMCVDRKEMVSGHTQAIDSASVRAMEQWNLEP